MKNRTRMCHLLVSDTYMDFPKWCYSEMMWEIAPVFFVLVQMHTGLTRNRWTSAVVQPPRQLLGGSDLRYLRVHLMNIQSSCVAKSCSKRVKKWGCDVIVEESNVCCLVCVLVHLFSANADIKGRSVLSTRLLDIKPVWRLCFQTVTTQLVSYKVLRNKVLQKKNKKAK